MEEEMAREMFPVWASSDAVRIVDEPTEQEKIPTRLLLSLKKEKFIKDHGILIVVALIGLLMSAAVGVITGTIVRRNTIDEMEHEYRAQMQAYLDQQEQERMAKSIVTGDASRAAAMKEDARAVAKAFYGIRNFIEVYHYDETDLRTYARCMFDRADSNGGTIHAVVSAPDQFIGYSDDNPVMDEYYNLALKFVDRWYYEETKPFGIDYQWAELLPDGIWLVNEFNASGYVRRLQDEG